jgi:hypothetical protein
MAIRRTPRERRSAPKKSITLSEKEDLSRHEVPTESETKLDFAVLETLFGKKPADFCIIHRSETLNFIHAAKVENYPGDPERKRAPVFGTDALEPISLTEITRCEYRVFSSLYERQLAQRREE